MCSPRTYSLVEEIVIHEGPRTVQYVVQAVIVTCKKHTGYDEKLV